MEGGKRRVGEGGKVPGVEGTYFGEVVEWMVVVKLVWVLLNLIAKSGCLIDPAGISV